MPDYNAYFLAGEVTAIELRLFEIEHPAFTQTYRFVQNAKDGVTVTLEDSSSAFFQYAPVRIKPIASSDDLDQALRFELGDLGEILPTEVDAMMEAGGILTKPVVRYRTYRDDDLSAPMDGPYLLETKNLSFNRSGCSFDARAPSLNVNRTGENYRVDRFPMLAGVM